MNKNDWTLNPNPKFPYPMCSYCFFETDCKHCQEIMLRALSVYEMFRIEDWIYDRLLYGIKKEKEEEFEVDYDSIVDDVDFILGGESGEKEKTNRSRNRKKVRKESKKDKKKDNVRGR